MGKKGRWFSGWKKALSPHAKETADPLQKSGKERKSWGFKKNKHKEQDVDAVPQAREGLVEGPVTEKSPVETGDQQNQHALAMAVATAAAAEAAVAAAHAAAEVVRLTDVSRARYAGKSREEIAAIKIQTAFRAYLARRALRALKGLVRLQALVRGQSVRRQATSTLRCMQALVKVQSQIRTRRIRMSEENKALQRQLLQKHAKELENMRANMEAKDWDDSLQSKEEIEASLQSKQEAALKRERAMAYAYSHQSLKNGSKANYPMLMEIDPNKPSWGWSWLERWMAARPWEKDGLDNLSAKDGEYSPGEFGRQLSYKGRGLSQSNMETSSISSKVTKRHSMGAGMQSPFTPSSKVSVASRNRNSSPRSMHTADDDARSMNSFRSERPRPFSRHSVAGSIRDDESLGSSPAVPSYMAPTESAKAKSRSNSTPRQRSASSDKDSVGSTKKRLSFPLTEGESGQHRANKNHGYSHINPVLRGFTGPLKMDRSMNSVQDLSINSDCPLLEENTRRRGK